MSKFSRFDHIEGDRIDPVTGEIIDHVSATKVSQIFKGVPEENFIKVYYDTFLASVGSNESVYTPLLLEIGKRMTWSENGQIVILIKSTKESIARSMGITLGRVNNMISDLVKMGLLIRVERATYAVSPFIMAKGEWDNVLSLQLNYNSALHQIEVSQPNRIPAPRPEHLKKIEKMGFPAAPQIENNNEENERNE